jgi:hypothetical protein
MYSRTSCGAALPCNAHLCEFDNGENTEKDGEMPFSRNLYPSQPLYVYKVNYSGGKSIHLPGQWPPTVVCMCMTFPHCTVICHPAGQR